MNLLSAAILPLRLHHPDGSTPVIVGEGALSSVLPELEDWLARRTAFLVTTPRVDALHGGRLGGVFPGAAGGGGPGRRVGGAWRWRRGRGRSPSRRPSGCGTRCSPPAASATAG